MPFSVLMSLYAKEHPQYLRDALKSIFCQTLQADEIVLVVDGPIGKDLQNVVDEFSHSHQALKVIPLPTNSGLGNALNKGLRCCTHELVARMDTDDICFPDRFEKQIGFMNNNPDIDIISSWLNEFENTPSNSVSIKKVPATHREISEYLKSRNPLNHPSVVFRKSAVETAGGYMHFPLFEDYYLWIRMYKSGAKFANIQEPLLHFRTSPEMFSRRGGYKYACDAVKFQWMLHRLGIISVLSAIKYSFIRGCVYIMPNVLRKFIYNNFLREKESSQSI